LSGAGVSVGAGVGWIVGIGAVVVAGVMAGSGTLVGAGVGGAEGLNIKTSASRMSASIAPSIIQALFPGFRIARTPLSPFVRVHSSPVGAVNARDWIIKSEKPAFST